MRTSGEYRRIARERLSDKWGKAIIAAMIMSFLGVSMAFVDGNVTVNYEDTSVSPLTKLINHPAWAKYAGFFAAVSVLITIISVINFVIGGAADLGYARFNMRIAEGDDVETVDIFSQMKRLIDGFVYRLLMVIYLILWTLCFIIPGIVKTFSYALTPYIMNDYPQLSPNQAITMSRKVMDGRKAKLFGLYLSFIGWAILANSPNIIIAFIANSDSYDFIASPLTFITVMVLTATVWAANCMLSTYAKAAEAAFYKDAIEDYTRLNADYGNNANFGNAYSAGYGQNDSQGISQNGYFNYGTGSNFANPDVHSGTDAEGNVNTENYSYGGGSGSEGGSSVENPFEIR